MSGLPIARLERRAFAHSTTQTLAQIDFQISGARAGEARRQRRSDGGLDRQRMNRDLRQGAQGRGALLRAAKIERASNTEAAQNLDIGLGDVAKMIGTEDLPPADLAAIARAIA